MHHVQVLDATAVDRARGRSNADGGLVPYDRLQGRKVTNVVTTTMMIMSDHHRCRRCFRDARPGVNSLLRGRS